MPYGHTLIIAEAGVNHNGAVDAACALIDAAAEARADAVKFQTFSAAAIASRFAPKAAYQMRTSDAAESQVQMLRKLELSEAAHETLILHARSKGIRFLSTPFDLASLDLLARNFGLETIKVGSGEITNAPFLIEVARTGCKVILSTGMSTLAEVEAALGVLAYGFTVGRQVAAGVPDFAAAFASDAGQVALQEHVSLLHCTSEYPASAAEVNLKAMDTLRSSFGLPVGLSDHTTGIHIAIAAAARGATIVEKHFTLDRQQAGPDHSASLEPSELCALVSAVREVELAIGDGIKRPTPSEIRNRAVARKSLVAARAIRTGQRIGPDDLAVKRPGIGVSPLMYWQQLGRTAARDYAEDELIDP